MRFFRGTCFNLSIDNLDEFGSDHEIGFISEADFTSSNHEAFKNWGGSIDQEMHTFRNIDKIAFNRWKDIIAPGDILTPSENILESLLKYGILGSESNSEIAFKNTN